MNSSQIVRQELRAVVSGRTNQQNVTSNNGNGTNNGIRTPQSPLGIGQPMVGGNAPGTQQNSNLMMSQQQPGTPILNTPPDLDPLRFNYDISQGM